MSEFWRASPAQGKGNARFRSTEELAMSDAKRLGLPCVARLRVEGEEVTELERKSTGFFRPSVPKKTKIAKALLAFRISRGWTQRQLAVVLGYSAASLASWETGVRPPGAVQVKRIEAILQVFGFVS